MSRLDPPFIDALTEQVGILRPGQEVRVLAKSDRAHGVDVLPGLDVPMADLLAV